MRVFPRNRESYVELAALYASEGRIDEARKTLDQMVVANKDRRSMEMAAATFDALDMPQDARRWRRAAAGRP